MRILLHIGPDGAGADRFQRILADKRGALADQGVLYARSPGGRNHTRLFMSVTDPARIDSLRHNRGYGPAAAQVRLYEDMRSALAREIDKEKPELLVLSAHQLGTSLVVKGEYQRLHALLSEFSNEIRILAHLDDPARMLARRYAAQVLEGRMRPLSLELGLLERGNFRAAALGSWPRGLPDRGLFPEAQGACFWLDFKQMQAAWDGIFGTGAMRFHDLDLAGLYSQHGADLVRIALGLDGQIGKSDAEDLPQQPSALWMSRARRMNDVLLRYLGRREAVLPRPLWRRLLGEIRLPGDPVAPGSLHRLSQHFQNDINDLIAEHPSLTRAAMAPDAPLEDWQEPDPQGGFRATQYLLANEWRIKQATREAKKAAEAAPEGDLGAALSPQAQDLLPPLAKQNFQRLQGSIFAPHNRLGCVNEAELAAAYPPAPPRILPKGSSGRVIVACMKNEAPYILEWVAYHRAIGVDHFLIYTNGCEDGTTKILDLLQALGVLQHRDNNDWSGNSPQQHALNNALREEVVINADWLIHIDVDEFMNIRCGNGTLDDFFAAAPDATNVAMTWRLFGHNGIARLDDQLVIDQFDACAPKYCPKPHTVWGFKTMFRNIGAYGKMSCHRPNKLADGFEDRVKWVNGSGQDMTGEAIKNGWRNSKKTIGYDLIQLNHYALRSAESFLIKRQRGRALHVDRNIGLNYWVRMDWCDHRDITIKRNVPRVNAELAQLKSDPELAKWHQKGLDWHRAKADELHANPEFEALYQRALTMKLTETERVAYALALDMES